jgi:hypothetical protein
MNASTRDATADRRWPSAPSTTGIRSLICSACGEERRAHPTNLCDGTWSTAVISPFVRRALAGILPAVEYTNGRRS